MPKPKRKSRPTRARGLKLVVDVVADAVVESRPTRARGLKPPRPAGPVVKVRSRPTRARGLKLEGRPFESNRLSSRPTWARGLKLARVAVAIGAVQSGPRGRVDLSVATWLACDIERRINRHAMDILNL